MKKIIAFILSICMLLSLCSCSPKQMLLDSISDIRVEETTTAVQVNGVGYKIPYDRTDSLNPYEITGNTNRCIAKLMFDSLYTVDTKFNAVAVMASSSSISDKTLTVALKDNLKFTDGNAVTGKDVVYSFDKAKESDEYSAYLGNISYAEYSGNTISFYLDYNSNTECANLTFPIIESGTDTSEDTEASKTVPIGSGRYYLKDDGSVKSLCVNKNRLGGYNPNYTTINLTAVSEVSAIQGLFSLGEIDVYTNDYSDGQFSTYTGSGYDYDLTNFVYLGVNSDSELLSNSKVRMAVSLLLNRADLAGISFAGHATATSIPIHPSCYSLNGCTLPTTKQNISAAEELLDNAGFNQINSDGIRCNEEENELKITLLVNKDNSFKLSLARSVQQSLEEADILVELSEYSYSDYVDAVENGEYTLYIGEAKLSNNFDLSRFFAEDSSLSYGIDTESECAKMYFDFLSGEATMQNFIDSFSDELPIIPIAFRKGVTIKSSKITTDIVSTPDDCFDNINEWTVS